MHEKQVLAGHGLIESSRQMAALDKSFMARHILQAETNRGAQDASTAPALVDLTNQRIQPLERDLAQKRTQIRDLEAQLVKEGIK